MRKEVTSFLKGDQHKIITQLEQKMQDAAEALEFERAKEYRDLIADLRKVGENKILPSTILWIGMS